MNVFEHSDKKWMGTGPLKNWRFVECNGPTGVYWQGWKHEKSLFAKGGIWRVIFTRQNLKDVVWEAEQAEKPKGYLNCNRCGEKIGKPNNLSPSWLCANCTWS